MHTLTAPSCCLDYQDDSLDVFMACTVPVRRLSSLTYRQLWNKPGTHASADLAEPRNTTMKDVIVGYLRRGKRVWLTGHSKGGSVATTAAAHLICGETSETIAAHLPGLSIVTFSSALVFKKRFADVYNDSLTRFQIDQISFRKKGDIVPNLPCWKGLSHVGTEVEIGNESDGAELALTLSGARDNKITSVPNLLGRAVTSVIALGMNHSLDAIHDGADNKDSGFVAGSLRGEGESASTCRGGGFRHHGMLGDSSLICKLL